MTELLRNLQDIDRQLTLSVNSLSTPWTDGVWQFFSDKEVWYPLYIAVAVMLFYRLGWKKALIVIASVAAAFALSDFVSNLVKYSVSRLRPAYDTEMLRGGIHLLEKRGSLFGFFSSHAANTFSFAICTFMGFRNDETRRYSAYGSFIFSWAVLVSISRVFVGKHFLGDITAGAIFGLLTGYLLASLARLAITKLR